MPSKKKKVFIAGDMSGDSGLLYRRMFENRGWEMTERIASADLVQFTGGVDVTPALYFEKAHDTTVFDSNRDFKDGLIYLFACKIGIPMAGICRGGQFLNVMNGGALWQDVDNHCETHQAHPVDREGWLPFSVSSTHHQMMIPANDAKIILIADESERRTSMSTDGVQYSEIRPEIGWRKDKPDIEAVFYKGGVYEEGGKQFRTGGSLCFQPHPEFSTTKNSPMQEFYFDCLERYLNV